MAGIMLQKNGYHYINIYTDRDDTMKKYTLKQLVNINYPKVLYMKYKDNPIVRLYYKFSSKRELRRLMRLSPKTLFPIELNYVNEVNQCTHPDAFVASKKYNNQIVMTVSGYPFGNEKYENQFVLVSNDGKHFSNVLGDKAVVTYIGNGKSYYSDGEIIEYNDKIYLFYRFCNVDDGKSEVTIFRKETDDLQHWYNEKKLLSDSGFKYISPAIIRFNDCFHMYYVEQIDTSNNSSLKRIVSRNLDFEDNLPSELIVNNKPDGMMLWHVDIIKQDDLLHGLFVFSSAGGGKNARLYYALSDDEGKTWNVHKQIKINVNYKFVSKIYRSSLIKLNNKNVLYVPICTTNNCWYILAVDDFDFNNYK